jgi:hypothetical protein
LAPIHPPLWSPSPVLQLIYNVGLYVQKKSSGADPHYLDVWLPTHDGDADAAEKLVSKNFKCYTQFVIYPCLLNIL